MTNNNFHKRILKISWTIFVSIICLCFVTTVSAQNRKDKNKQTPTNQPSRIFRQPSQTSPQRIMPNRQTPSRQTPSRQTSSRQIPSRPIPQIKRESTNIENSRRTISTKPIVTTESKSQSRPFSKPLTTKKSNSEIQPSSSSYSKLTDVTKSADVTKSTSEPKTTAYSSKSKNSTTKPAPKTDPKLPTFRRSNQTITASGKVETRTKSPPISTNVTKNSVTSINSTPAATASKANTDVKSAKSGNTQANRVSDLLRRSKSSSRKSASNAAVNNRNNNNLIIAPSPNRVGGRHIKQPNRAEEVAKAINKSNRSRTSHPQYRHPPQAAVKNVRKNFHGYNDYWTNDWYRRHPGSWRPVSVPNRRWWQRPHWRDFYDWFDTVFFAGVTFNRMWNTYSYYPYYYGTNVVYTGDMVYVNGVPYVSSAEYYRQALMLARTADALVRAENTPQIIVINQQQPEQAQVEAAQPEQAQVEQAQVEQAQPEIVQIEQAAQAQAQANQQNVQADDGWLPMGTFTFLDIEDENSIENVNLNVNDANSQKTTHEILQLATNKMGQIRGNFVDEKNNKIRQMIGAIDPKTQRVALRFTDDNKIVWECGLWNLTQDTLPILIHSDESKTEQKILIRLTDNNDIDNNADADEDEIELAP
ncbi:MAG: hypothetical protein LBE18_00245 [Planctomycetaceae bacterium]|jgi:hypothetical protein|nr:hypothetical protein [Planctomycetaceae bacterium]